MAKIKRILVPIDFSQPSLAALRYAVELARTLKARIELVHVVEIFAYAPMVGPAIDLERLREAQERAARDRFGALEKALRAKRLRCRTRLVLGFPASAIVDVARRSATDLIVMATKGRHGVGRLLLGSVAERVVRTSTCPVLTIRDRGGRR